MKCPECNFENKKYAKYCEKCGAYLSQDEKPNKWSSLISFIIALFSTSFFYQIFPVPLIELSYWGKILTSHWICKIIIFLGFWSVYLLLLYYYHLQKNYKTFEKIKNEITLLEIINLSSLKKLFYNNNYKKYFQHPLYRIIKKINKTPNNLNDIIDDEIYKVDLNYTLIKYFIWAIPILGFVGTVAGIAMSVSEFSTFIQNLKEITEISNNMKIALSGVTKGLAAAFNTTFLALITIIPIMLFNNLLQKKEEEFLLDIKEFILQNTQSSIKKHLKIYRYK